MAKSYLTHLKDNPEKKITLHGAFQKDALKMINAAKEVLRDRSKAHELMPKDVSHCFLKGDATYDEVYFEEVQEILDQLEMAYKNTAWDNHEIWFFYEDPGRSDQPPDLDPLAVTSPQR